MQVCHAYTRTNKGRPPLRVAHLGAHLNCLCFYFKLAFSPKLAVPRSFSDEYKRDTGVTRWLHPINPLPQ